MTSVSFALFRLLCFVCSVCRYEFNVTLVWVDIGFRRFSSCLVMHGVVPMRRIMSLVVCAALRDSCGSGTLSRKNEGFRDKVSLTLP